LLFFQTLLLAGYGYAHGLTRLRTPLRQAGVHVLLVLIALALLPITPDDRWKPLDGAHPTWRILVLLTVCVGLPYFLLAATSPLIQVWFSRVYPGRSPYRLYALSNAGSLVALGCYPFLVEPQLSTPAQGNSWSVAFVIYGLLCIGLTVALWKNPWSNGKASASRDADAASREPPATARQRLQWFLLPMLASVLLMALTNHVCQEVASVPLLWLAPLTLYLLSFIICFEREAWYRRRVWAFLTLAIMVLVSYLALGAYLTTFWEDLGYGVLWYQLTHSVFLQAGLYLSLLFCSCMVCHGELARRKPPPSSLTQYYLIIAAGGAAGGVCVALICPMIFASYLERSIAVVAMLALTLAVLVSDGAWASLRARSRTLPIAAGAVAATAAMITFWGQFGRLTAGETILQARNFYGVLRVEEAFPADPEYHGLSLYHGKTLHGYQHLLEGLRERPTTYYTPSSGVGRAFRALRPRGPLRVGIVGLGVGTLATYGLPEDQFTFYEINPLVVEIAERRFTFLDDSFAEITIVPGDARMSLEAQPPQEFDLLVLDAFGDDTVPVHLLTLEALQLYLRHIQPKGIIAVHISCVHVDLVPVLMGIARHERLVDLVIRDDTEDFFSIAPSSWVLLAEDESVLQQQPIDEAAMRTLPTQKMPLWTDRYSNLFDVLRF
jgi:hypothetical protein